MIGKCNCRLLAKCRKRRESAGLKVTCRACSVTCLRGMVGALVSLKF